MGRYSHGRKLSLGGCADVQLVCVEMVSGNVNHSEGGCIGGYGQCSVDPDRTPHTLADRLTASN